MSSILVYSEYAYNYRGQMKRKLSLVLVISIAFGMAIMPIMDAQAQMNPPRQPRGQRPPTHRTNGFDGLSENLNITGSIEVTDAIILSLSIQPTQEALARIEERRMDQQIPDFNNTISVAFTDLVEFEDLTNDGFSSDDTIVSIYALDSSNLNNVIINEDGDNTIYTITSIDNSFKMYVEIMTTNNVPHDWKWTLEINYNFLSTTSDLTMVHSIETTRGNMLRENYGAMNGTISEFQSREIRGINQHVPMIFKWDGNATADGVTVDVIPTKVGDLLYLSVDQGSTINYDPSIGLDPEAIAELDVELSAFTSVVKDFVDTILSPIRNVLILTALILLSGIVVVKFSRRE